MPARAKQCAGAEYELPVARIAELLVEATSSQGASGTAAENDMPDELRNEAEKAKLESQANKEKNGKPSAFACPECHGVMWEMEEGTLLRRIGARAGERQAISYNEEAGGYDKHAETIRDLLVQNQGVQVREESKAERA